MTSFHPTAVAAPQAQLREGDARGEQREARGERRAGGKEEKNRDTVRHTGREPTPSLILPSRSAGGKIGNSAWQEAPAQLINATSATFSDI